jgi:2-polyprenyl-6-methoxyphenol hydroxylase-like FAD-dependent oxidoreductase
MHAIMLRSVGFKVTIIEQEISDSRFGYDAGIRAGPDVVKFLEEYDKMDSKYRLHAATQFMNKRDKPIFKSSKMMAWTSWALLWSILRKNFDSLSTSDENGNVGASAFLQGRRLTGLNDLGTKVELQVDDLINHSTSSLNADIVIVADGTNSIIRGQLIPNNVRKYAGYVSWRGVVPEAHVSKEYRQVLEGRVTFHFMHRSYIIV